MEENLEVIPLKSGVGQGCPVSLLIFNVVLTALTGTGGQEKETKRIQMGRAVVVGGVLLSQRSCDDVQEARPSPDWGLLAFPLRGLECVAVRSLEPL